MRDDRVEKLADVLVHYSTGVKKDDLVLIRGADVAEPLLLAIYRRCLEVGAHPRLQVALPAAEPLFYELAQDHQLDHVWAPDKWLFENVDVSFNVLSDVNTRQLTKVDHAKQARAARARRPLLDTFFKRSAKGEVNWNITLWPTQLSLWTLR